MSAFDPNIFLDAQQKEANERRPNIPQENPAAADGCYLARIGEITTTSGTISKGDNAGKHWARMVIPLHLQLPSEVQALGLPAEFQLTDRVFLDLNDSGGLDNSKGKNRGQRAYREATGMNKPGEPFAWRMLSGKTVRVHLKHEMYEGNIQEKPAQILPA